MLTVWVKGLGGGLSTSRHYGADRSVAARAVVMTPAMLTTTSIAEIGAMVGEPARAAMLLNLMDGRALTAGELARAAGVAPQTASGHLAQLARAGLIGVEKQGRHHYHRLASPRVAQMLESLMDLAAARAAPERRVSAGPRDAALRAARTCYDHIAGRLGVAISDAMIARGLIECSDEGALVTGDGSAFLAALGTRFDAAARAPKLSRPFCRLCLDWSERRPQIAGRLGAAICAHSLSRGWVRRRAGTRALDVTPGGERSFREVFGVER